MNAVIDQGFRGKDKSGKFVKDNELRFQKKELTEPEGPTEDQMELDLTEPEASLEPVDLVPPDEE